MTIRHPSEQRQVSAQDTWYVYLLIDPRDGRPFYVGCTTMPFGRWCAHRFGRVYPASQKCQEIEAEGGMPILETIGEFGDKKEARSRESFFIKMIPGTLNRVGVFNQK